MISSPRICLVTGAATGIGAACALAFAKDGWTVVIGHLGVVTRREADAVASACRIAGAATLILELDVTSDATCRQAIEAVLLKWGRLDALINCAGTTRFIAHGDLEALDAEEFRRTYEVNLIGIHQMIRAASKALCASGSGSVVNISSVAGLVGRGSSIAYAASKGALNTMTLALARSLAPAIRVNAIAPGFVAGGLPGRVLEAAQLEAITTQSTQSAVLKRISQPDEVAALAWFLCAHAPGITGDVILLDNGLHLNAG